MRREIQLTPRKRKEPSISPSQIPSRPVRKTSTSPSGEQLGLCSGTKRMRRSSLESRQVDEAAALGWTYSPHQGGRRVTTVSSSSPECRSSWASRRKTKAADHHSVQGQRQHRHDPRTPPRAPRPRSGSPPPPSPIATSTSATETTPVSRHAVFCNSLLKSTVDTIVGEVKAFVDLYGTPLEASRVLASHVMEPIGPPELARGVQLGLSHVIRNYSEDTGALTRFIEVGGNMKEFYARDIGKSGRFICAFPAASAAIQHWAQKKSRDYLAILADCAELVSSPTAALTLEQSHSRGAAFTRTSGRAGDNWRRRCQRKKYCSTAGPWVVTPGRNQYTEAAGL